MVKLNQLYFPWSPSLHADWKSVLLIHAYNIYSKYLLDAEEICFVYIYIYIYIYILLWRVTSQKQDGH